MACNASKTNFLRIVTKRGYSARAKPQSSVARSLGVQTTTLPNKLVVASTESPLPVSRVSILFRAGSRNESYEDLGASHILRAGAGLTTKNSSAFAITRNIQQVGGALTVTGDRETLTFTVEVTNNNLETGLKFLQDVATGPTFKPWEIKALAERLRIDLAAVPTQVRAVELLHKAAFRRGLGNSIFIPKYQIGRISPESLQHYFASNFTTNRAAVVGVGVDQRLLAGFAQNLELESGSGQDTASKYVGGELRKDRATDLAHVAIAGEGAAITNTKEALAFAVLQQAAGVGPATKRGSQNGALTKQVARAVEDAPLNISALNASYTDAGLFGIVLSVDGRLAGKAAEAAVKALKSGSVSAEDVGRGKALLKAAILSQNNSNAGLLTDLGSQAVLLGNVQDAAALVAAVDAVSAADVTAAARKVASSNFSVGAVGNLGNVPYLSDIN